LVLLKLFFSFLKLRLNYLFWLLFHTNQCIKKIILKYLPLCRNHSHIVTFFHYSFIAILGNTWPFSVHVLKFIRVDFFMNKKLKITVIDCHVKTMHGYLMVNSNERWTLLNGSKWLKANSETQSELKTKVIQNFLRSFRGNGTWAKC